MKKESNTSPPKGIKKPPPPPAPPRSKEMTNTLTCVYCGKAYPEGTPPHGAKILTDHIKVCKKHPMREAEAKITNLQLALVDLVCLKSIVEFISTQPNEDKLVMINAIKVLAETMEKE